MEHELQQKAVIAAPLTGSTTADEPPQKRCRDSEGIPESATLVAHTSADADERALIFAAELEEIRRQRGLNYKRSKQAALREAPASTSLTHSNSRRLNVLKENKEETTGDRERSGGVEDSSAVSAFDRRRFGDILLANKNSSRRRSALEDSLAVPAARREVIVIDGDEELCSVVNTTTAESRKTIVSATVKETAKVVSNDVLPIWEDKFDLLTWNVDGLDEEALRSRMKAVIDLTASLRPAVVFFQEIVPQTLVLLRKFLEASYFIYTPSHPTPNGENARYTSSTSCSDSNESCPLNDACSSSTCDQNATTALNSNEGHANVGFPYFSVILLCREQMAPLTPEALCEWFPHSRMGRHLLGIVAAPLSRPDDRLLLLTSHLESLKEFQEERVNQFNRCIRVLTTSFEEEKGGNSEDDKEKKKGTRGAQTRSDEELGKFSRGGVAHGLLIAAHNGNSGAAETEDPECADKSETEEKRNVKESRRTSDKQKREDRKSTHILKAAGDTECQKEEKSGQSRRQMPHVEKVETLKGKLREIPAFVGILGGDMNLRDSELCARAAAGSSASRYKTWKQQTGASRGPKCSSICGERETVYSKHGCKKKSPQGDQSSVDTGLARANEAESSSVLLPGVEDVWDYLGRPASTKYTWDMQRNDNKKSGKWKSRLRFDRLYWYGVPVHAAGTKQPEKGARGVGTKGGGFTLTDKKPRVFKETDASSEGTRANKIARASKRALSSEKANLQNVKQTNEDSCQDECSVRLGKKKEFVVRWTWKPQSLNLVGTHKVALCGRFPSDHFGLLARFTREPIHENTL